MYNENIKKRYIEYKNSITTLKPTFLKTQFKSTEEAERELGKDLCNFNKKEILDLYTTKSLRSLETIRNINAQFKEYTDWCIEEGMVFNHQNEFELVTGEEMLRCVNTLLFKKSIVTREELIKAIRKFDNACDQYMFLALFEGILGNCYTDIINIELKSLRGNVVTLPSTKKRIEISEELKSITVKSCETYRYRTQTRTLTLEGNKVIKERHNVRNISEERRQLRFSQTFDRKKKEIGLDHVTPNTLFVSGMLDYIKTGYQKEKEECPELSIEYYICENKEKIAYRYKPIKAIKDFIKKYEEYLS